MPDRPEQGIGLVAELHATAGELFAAAFALFSGLMFIVVAGLLFAPLIHRVFPKFPLECGRMRKDD